MEPLAGRVEEFLRELAEMGPTEREAHLRYAMNPKAEAVVLVTGDSGIDRDAVFNGFNTPLLPDILVCTQVGQEGIDLHRHCRHVVHYDLGWNPATLEQRTGRTDRLGSKAMRERNLALAARNGAGGSDDAPSTLPGLDIALPYLAGTYGMLKQKWPKQLFGHELCDLLVLDEASQMNLPEALMAALPLKRNAPIEVVGDHRQMPPIVKHDWDAEARRTFRQYQAYRSLFDTLRLQNPPPPMIRFAESFRLHRVMAEFLRREVYRHDGIKYHSKKTELLAAHSHDDDFTAAVLDPAYPLVVVVHDEAASQVRNPFEQSLITPILRTLSDKAKYGLDPAEGLGVVVPHRAQRAALQQAFPELSVIDLATGLPARSAVDTVERFQGGERTVVMVSATESDRGYLLTSAGFLLDPRRLTVAVSRAKRKMILVASRSVFSLFSPDEETFRNAMLWKNLLFHTCVNKLWSGVRDGVLVRVWGGATVEGESDVVTRRPKPWASHGGSRRLESRTCRMFESICSCGASGCKQGLRRPVESDPLDANVATRCQTVCRYPVELGLPAGSERRAVSHYQYDGSLRDVLSVQTRRGVTPQVLRDQSRTIWYVLDEDGNDYAAIRAKRGPGGRGWVREKTRDIRDKLFSDKTFGAARGLYITPFVAQARAIRVYLAAKKLESWSAASVHSQQGTEADVVVFDTVHAGSTAWPSEEWKRLINVGLSRAREHVIFLASRAEMRQPYLCGLTEHLVPRVIDSESIGNGNIPVALG